MRRGGAVAAALAVATVLAGCGDGFFHDPSSDRAASITVVFAQGADGATAA